MNSLHLASTVTRPD